jgi:hypothetical protein
MSHAFHNPILTRWHMREQMPTLVWLLLAATAATLLIAAGMDLNGATVFPSVTT